MRRIFLLGFFLLPLTLVSAQSHLEDSDLPRFAQAQVVETHGQLQVERFYPLAPLRRISGRLQAEHVQASGEVKTLTYQLPTGHPPKELLQQARQDLQATGYRVLYWCEGRECGSSSLWANQVFANAKLYGPEDQQSYLLLQQGQRLIALYGITRGNRRMYLHAEQFTATESLPALLPSASTLLRQLREDGELSWVAIGPPEAAGVELLVATMTLDSTLRLALSGSQASAWLEALESQGIRARRLQLNEDGAEGLRLKPF